MLTAERGRAVLVSVVCLIAAAVVGTQLFSVIRGDTAERPPATEIGIETRLEIFDARVVGGRIVLDDLSSDESWFMGTITFTNVGDIARSVEGAHFGARPLPIAKRDCSISGTQGVVGPGLTQRTLIPAGESVTAPLVASLVTVDGCFVSVRLPYGEYELGSPLEIDGRSFLSETIEVDFRECAHVPSSGADEEPC